MTLADERDAVGMPKLNLIEENTRIARGFKRMTKPEMDELSGALSGKNKAALDLYLKNHVDHYSA